MTVVVGYIPSPPGLAAVEAAIAEAQLRKAKLVVVNSGVSGDFSSPSYADPKDLDALEGQLAERGIEHEVRQSARGLAPADEILAVADEVNADLIVIGVRKRSPLGKMVTGSTAQQVLLDSTCPVLAVKA